MSEMTVDNAPPTQVRSEFVISTDDLKNVLAIFDLASGRGAFRGPELEVIGKLYTKINTFVQVASPVPPVPPSPDAANPKV
jgi:hypothetical protein